MSAILILHSVVDVAQLVRAPDCGSGGRGFESHHPPQVEANFLLFILLGRSQAVRQRALDPRCAGSNPAAPAR